MFNEIFSTPEGSSNKEVTVLSKTADLSVLARQQAESFIESLKDVEQERVEASFTDYSILESLIQEVIDNANVSSIEGADTLEVKRMLKSQASSKSHNKKKLVETKAFGYYKAYAQAAIAESLLRKAYNIPRTSFGSVNASRTSITYSEEELEALKKDQHKLRAVIRNVQSKKCIEKKKDNYEESERYQQILDAETQLFSIRTNVEPKESLRNQLLNNVVMPDGTTLSSLPEIESLKKPELISLLQKIVEVINNG